VLGYYSDIDFLGYIPKTLWNKADDGWFLFFTGGTPYPLLGNAEIMRRLKTGYRMEKPDLCSDNL